MSQKFQFADAEDKTQFLTVITAKVDIPVEELVNAGDKFATVIAERLGGLSEDVIKLWDANRNKIVPVVEGEGN
jgi:hypothetical protein